MKFSKCLLLLPSLLLAACSGAELSEPEANRRIDIVKNNTKPIYGTSMKFEMEYKNAEGKDKEREEANYSLKYRYDELTNDMYFYQKGSMSYTGSNTDYVEYYKVKKSATEYVVWYSFSYQGLSGKGAFYDNESSDESVESLPNSVSLVGFIGIATKDELLRQYNNPNAVTQGYNAKYFGIAEDDLKVVALFTDKEKHSDNEEYMKKARIEATFVDGRLSTYNGNSVTSYNNKSSFKISVDYSKQSIKLPSGWEKLIKK